MIVRHWRPLIVVAIWLFLIALSVVFSSPPQMTGWTVGGEESLFRAFHLSPEPTLLVFHRPGGLIPDDRAFAEGLVAGVLSEKGDVPRRASQSGETLVLSVAAEPVEVARIQAALQSAPDGLQTHVTGAAAFAYDAVAAWEWSRPFVLLSVVALAGLVALLGRLGAGGALVVAFSAGAAATVTSALAALFAPSSPVALAMVLSAGLAGSWAVRLLMGSPQSARSLLIRPRPAETEPASLPEPGQESAREVTPQQRLLIVTGEMTLLQAFVIVVGLAGFLVDYRAGGALLVGLIVAVAVGLSAAPALAALLARLRPSPPFSGRVLRLWVRLGLALVPIAGLVWLVPTARPSDGVSPRSGAAVGYDLLLTVAQAQETEVAPARLLPVHLLIRPPMDILDPAGMTLLQGLIADLNARPALAAVEGGEALQITSLPDEIPAALARWEGRVTEMETALAAQAGALSQAITDVAGLNLSVDLSPVEAALGQAREQLVSVRASLVSLGVDFSRIPSEFPEVASRIDHVPTLKMMPASLEAAVAELDQVSSQMGEAITQTKALSAELAGRPLAPHLTALQAHLADAAVALEARLADLSALHSEVRHLEELWAQVVADSRPASTGNSRLIRQDLLHLTLIPAGDPYAQATLDEVQTLPEVVGRRFSGGPLAGSTVAWTGAPVTAASFRAQALGNLLRGLLLAVVAVALVTWGMSLRLAATLLVTGGALLGAGAGVGVASLVLREVDAGAMALAAVAAVALAGGRMIVGRAPVVEDLVLALPPLALILSGVPVLMAVGLVLSAGLLTTSFLLVPTLIRRPRRMRQENE